jgi:hypothetical protein
VGTEVPRIIWLLLSTFNAWQEMVGLHFGPLFSDSSGHPGRDVQTNELIWRYFPLRWIQYHFEFQSKLGGKKGGKMRQCNKDK